MGIILKCLGLINALYLLTLRDKSGFGCSQNDGCSDVIASVFGDIFGVPLAAFGVSLFIVLIFIEILKYKKNVEEKTAESLNILLLVPATAIGIILIGVQVFYLKAFCQYCTFNSLVIIFLLAQLLIKRKTPGIELSSLNLPVVTSLVLFSIIPIIATIDISSTKSNKIGVIGEDVISEKGLKNSKYNLKIQSLENDIIKYKKRYFEELLVDVASKKVNMGTNNYVKQFIESKVEISEDDMMMFYEENKHHLKNNESFEVVKNSIRGVLFEDQFNLEYKKHIKTLYSDLNASFLIDTIKNMKVYTNIHQNLSFGNKNAPIRIVEFSDLQCGYCKTAFYSIKKLLKEYKDEIYFEYRHYPLAGHKYAKEYAKGSICAEDQEKGFEFIDMTFQNQRKLAQIRPEEIANDLGLNIQEFKACLTSERASLVLQYDMNEGDRNGVSRTPTFIINNELLDGIPTKEDIIDYL